MENDIRHVFTSSNIRNKDKNVIEYLKDTNWTNDELRKIIMLMEDSNILSLRDASNIFTNERVIEVGVFDKYPSYYIILLFQNDIGPNVMKKKYYDDNIIPINNRAGWSRIGPAWE